MFLKAHQLKLRRSMMTEQAAQLVLANCIAKIQDSRSAMLQHDDPECIHRQHINLRHLQSALKLFRKTLFLPEKLQAELSSLSLKLGAAHDWRLLSDSCLTAIKPITEEPQISALRQVAVKLTEEREKIAYVALGSGRFARLLSDLSSWLAAVNAQATNRARKKKRSCEKLCHFAQKNLHRQQLHLLMHGDTLFGKKTELNLEESHQFRIAVKRLRNSCLFFKKLFPKKDMDDYLVALSTLQDRLGMINDVVVADRLLCELARGNIKQVATSSFVRGYLLFHSKQYQRKLPPLWKRFRELKLPKLK